MLAHPHFVDVCTVRTVMQELARHTGVPWSGSSRSISVQTPHGTVRLSLAQGPFPEETRVPRHISNHPPARPAPGPIGPFECHLFGVHHLPVAENWSEAAWEDPQDPSNDLRSQRLDSRQQVLLDRASLFPLLRPDARSQARILSSPCHHLVSRVRRVTGELSAAWQDDAQAPLWRVHQLTAPETWHVQGSVRGRSASLCSIAFLDFGLVGVDVRSHQTNTCAPRGYVRPRCWCAQLPGCIHP